MNQEERTIAVVEYMGCLQDQSLITMTHLFEILNHLEDEFSNQVGVDHVRNYDEVSFPLIKYKQV